MPCFFESSPFRPQFPIFFGQWTCSTLCWLLKKDYIQINYPIAKKIDHWLSHISPRKSILLIRLSLHSLDKTFRWFILSLQPISFCLRFLQNFLVIAGFLYLQLCFILFCLLLSLVLLLSSFFLLLSLWPKFWDHFIFYFLHNLYVIGALAIILIFWWTFLMFNPYLLYIFIILFFELQIFFASISLWLFLLL